MSFRTLARNRDFTVLWIGQTISGLGTAMSTFAFPLVAYALTRSTLISALAEAAHLAGQLSTLLPAGVWADRHDRKMIMRVSAAAGVVLYVSLAIAGILHVLTVPHLIVVAFATGAAGGLFQPAETGAVRQVVTTEELPTALSQNQARQHIASLLGAPVGGVLLAVARWMPFAADAVSYLVNFVLLGRIRTALTPRPTTMAQTESAWARVVAGWRYMFTDPLLRVLGVWAPLTNLVVNAVYVAAMLRLVQLGFPAWQIGLVTTVEGLFGILGALCAPMIIARMPTGLLMITSAWAFVPLLLPMALWNTPWVVGASIAVGIFLNPAGNAGISSYTQSRMPVDMLGRFSSTLSFTSMSLMPLAPVLGGGLIALLGGHLGIALLAVPCALVALIPTLSKAVRAVPRPERWSRVEADRAAEPVTP